MRPREDKKKLALLGYSFASRTESESCIAQNLCSVTINLQERGALTEHEWRAECYCMVLSEGYQTCAKSRIPYKY